MNRWMLLLVVLGTTLAASAEEAGAQANQVRLRMMGEVSFPDEDPDFVPEIGPDRVFMMVQVRTATGSPWNLSILGTDLTDGPAVIPIGNVRWTGTPAPQVVDGTMSGTIAQPLANGTSRETVLVRLDFYLANSWDYPVGNYTSNSVVTLASP